MNKCVWCAEKKEVTFKFKQNVFNHAGPTFLCLECKSDPKVRKLLKDVVKPNPGAGNG